MRKLTKDQIISILGIYANNQIESVVIYINQINIGFKNNYEFNDDILYKYKDPIKEWLKKELLKLPDEARQHVEYLTCHPTVIVEISFPNKNLDGNNTPPWSKFSGGASIVVKS